MTGPINTELPSSLTFPKNTLELIFHARNDVRILRATCTHFRECFQHIFNANTHQLFAQRYGAIAACEQNTPLYILVRRIKSSAALAAQMRLDLQKLSNTALLFAFGMPRRHDLWLELDEENVPRLIDYQKRFFESATSPVDLEAKKWFCISNFKQKKQLLGLLYQQCRVAFELVLGTFRSKQPLQEFRNRCLRLHLLSIERNSLSCALETSEACFDTFLGTLSKTEQAICRFLVPQPNRILPLENSYELLNKRGVTLCETSFLSWGMEIPVEIVASYEFSGDVIKPAIMKFSATPRHRYTTLGSFSIEKIRYNAINYSILYIHSFVEIVKQDIDTDTWPIARLLIQLAVEVFNHELTRELEIVAPHVYANVFSDAGFLLIDRKGTVSTFSLEKSSTCPQTQFVIKDDDDIEHIAWAAPGLTWEEQIKRNPLLSFPKGPILPPLLFL